MCMPSIRYIPRSRISSSEVCNLYPYQQIMRTPMAPLPSQHMVLSVFLIWQCSECVVSSYCAFHYHLTEYWWNWSDFHMCINNLEFLICEGSIQVFAFFQLGLYIYIFVPVLYLFWMSSFDHLYVENIYFFFCVIIFSFFHVSFDQQILYFFFFCLYHIAYKILILDQGLSLGHSSESTKL